VIWGGMTGLYVAMAALVLSFRTQNAWLWWRSRALFASLRARDRAVALQ